MKVFFSFLFLMLIPAAAVFSQFYSSETANTSLVQSPERNISEIGTGKIILEYNIPAFLQQKQVHGDKEYTSLYIKDFSQLKEVGRPALPSHNDWIAVPINGEITVRLIDYKTDKMENVLVMPALRPATDRWGDGEPEFEIDTGFYNSDVIYPQNPVDIISTPVISGNRIALVRITPFQYNPFTKELLVYTYLKYAIEYQGETIKADPSTPVSQLNCLQNITLNNEVFYEESERKTRNEKLYRNNDNAINYLIITPTKYLQAADTLAWWKRQLGYGVEVISRSTWTSKQVKQEIATRYNTYHPKPEYFVIIGDNEDVPGDNLICPTGAKFASDLYFACFDGSGDFYPDMAHGRISVNSSTSALAVVQKIINYERQPYMDSTLYKTGLNCAQFQDDDRNSYADRRFSQTSEDVKNYIEKNTDIKVNRVYATETDVTPKYWNKDLYSAGEPIDSSLLKPGFPWNGSKTDIANGINNGVLYVLHRDHGYAGGTGWHMPQFMTSDVKSLLNNGKKLPIVFSINCHTGEYQVSECFAEAFLRKTDGGAAGVVAAAYYSYSGYNDALSMGMFDAIWSKPGLIPKFTGSGGIKNPSVKPHDDIYQMGNVVNQGLFRMAETWGEDKYTFELFHYFGDPSTKIWTKPPVPITIQAMADTIICGTTSFTVSGCSVDDALVTMLVDGELIAKGYTSGGSCTLTYPPIAGSSAYITISKYNHAPLVRIIPITGGCPKAVFTVGTEVYCVENQITFTNKSSGTITSYLWEFGNDALPSTASTAGPHKVLFASPGHKTIRLTVSGPSGSSVYEKTIEIDEICMFSTPTSGTTTYKNCTGYLYDNGGKDLYSNNTDGRVVISPTGASSVTLQFLSFDFDSGKDSIIIYDGATTGAPIIGSYSGNNLPNGGKITSSGNSILIRQRTNSSVQKSGFELYFYCNKNSSPPVANFLVSSETSCSGIIKLIDITRNKPDSWIWDFGNGDTSQQQNPVFLYSQEGEYDIQLIASNSYGSDTISKEKLVKIIFPDAPEVIDGHTCVSGSAKLEALCPGTPEWFDTAVGGTMLARSRKFYTPVITQNTTYYVQQNASVYHVGPESTVIAGGGGSYYTASNEQGLIFSCFKPLKLISVLVSASGEKQRTITLKNSDGSTLASRTVNIPNGISRVELNFDIPVGEGLKLSAANNPSLFRHQSGAKYPYEIQGIISITGNTATYPGYYYFFYDWELADGDSCRSHRVEAKAIIDKNPPAADFNFRDSGLYYQFINQSSDYNKFVWSFGDGSTDTINIHPEHKYANAGTYNVQLGVYNACGSNFKFRSLTVINAIDDNNNREINIFPNPNDGVFYLKINNETLKTLSLTDISGRLLWENNSPSADKLVRIDVPENTEGIYLLKVVSENGIKIYKVLIKNN